LKAWFGAVDQLGVWVTECSAQVKEEPAGEARRARDTEQSTLPPRLRAAYGKHGRLSRVPAMEGLPAWQTLRATSSYWGTRNRQSPAGSTPLVAVANHPMPNDCGFRNRCSVFGLSKRTVHVPGAAAGGGGRRFLVPQYEADDPTGCCAATAQKRLRITTRTSPEVPLKTKR
jgi:hypothetical protein